MRQHLLKLVTRLELWAMRDCEVARCGNIVISDMRKQCSTRFRDCILASLELVRMCDPLRYRRIHRRLSWIFNCPLEVASEGHYDHRTRTCEIDFDEPGYETDPEYWVGWNACVLVHEATHGAIAARGIIYSPELRSRIEQACVAEEHRFLGRLAESQPELASRLHCDFDESNWHPSWNAGRTATLFRKLRRAFSNDWRPAFRSRRFAG